MNVLQVSRIHLSHQVQSSSLVNHNTFIMHVLQGSQKSLQTDQCYSLEPGAAHRMYLRSVRLSNCSEHRQ